MIDTKWYTDQTAKHTFQQFEQHIKPMCERLIPSHAFTHMGINRNDLTNEVVIRIHLRPIGEAHWINERLNRPDLELLK